MSVRTRKIAALLSATALIGGAGVGIADAAKSGSSRTTTSAKQGRHGPGRGPIPSAAIEKIASTLGVSSDALKAALEANRPAKPAEGDRPGPGQLASDLATALGVETSAVKEILDANKPPKPTSRPKPGSMPPKPDTTKLVSALATGLNIDQATVQAAFDKLQAAHEAEHQARETAMFEALAKSLGKTADEVKAAFEANRPAPPTS